MIQLNFLSLKQALASFLSQPCERGVGIFTQTNRKALFANVEETLQLLLENGVISDFESKKQTSSFSVATELGNISFTVGVWEWQQWCGCQLSGAIVEPSLPLSSVMQIVAKTRYPVENMPLIVLQEEI